MTNNENSDVTVKDQFRLVELYMRQLPLLLPRVGFSLEIERYRGMEEESEKGVMGKKRGAK